MLETREERVRLLKAGVFGKTIEKLYLKSNYFKIVENAAAGISITEIIDHQ